MGSDAMYVRSPFSGAIKFLGVVLPLYTMSPNKSAKVAHLTLRTILWNWNACAFSHS